LEKDPGKQTINWGESKRPMTKSFWRGVAEWRGRTSEQTGLKRDETGPGEHIGVRALHGEKKRDQPE